MTKYVLISLCVLQNIHATEIDLKHRVEVDLEYVKKSLGALIVKYSEDLWVENVQQVSDTLYTANLPDNDTPGIFVSVHHPQSKMGRMSALYIPKKTVHPSSSRSTQYCEISLGRNVDDLFLRLQDIWLLQQERAMNQRLKQWEFYKKQLDALRETPDNLLLAAHLDKETYDNNAFFNIMNIPEAELCVFKTPGESGSIGSINIPYKEGEPKLYFPFTAEQTPQEVVSTRLKNIVWAKTFYATYFWLDAIEYGIDRYYTLWEQRNPQEQHQRHSSKSPQ